MKVPAAGKSEGRFARVFFSLGEQINSLCHLLLRTESKRFLFVLNLVKKSIA